MTTDHDSNPHQLTTAPVVVGVDGTAASLLALRWAASVAADRSRELRIVHALNLGEARAVLGSYDLIVPGVMDNIRKHGARVVQIAKALAQESFENLRITAEISADSPARVLIHESASAHMTVVGASAAGHLGSTVQAVTHHASGPVVAVRQADGQDGLRHSGPVVLGVDGSVAGDAAIGVAFEEAARRGGELIAMHAWSDLYFGRYAGRLHATLPADQLEVAERAILAERLAGWCEKYPDVTVHRKILMSGPGQFLLEASNTAQLAVVGSRGRGGFAELLLGSTSSFLIQHAHCPVMVVRPENR